MRKPRIPILDYILSIICMEPRPRQQLPEFVGKRSVLRWDCYPGTYASWYHNCLCEILRYARVW
jgi:hypothetical protein